MNVRHHLFIELLMSLDMSQQLVQYLLTGMIRSMSQRGRV